MERHLGVEPDPDDVLITHASEPMRPQPISTRANSPRNDDGDLLTEIEIAAAS